MKTEKFQVTGMTCASCQAHITKGVQKVSGVQEVNVSLLANQMTVTYDETIADSQAVIDAVVNVGYGASSMQQEQQGNEFRNDWEQRQEQTEKEQKAMRFRLTASAVLLVPLLYLAMGHVKGSNLLLEKLVSGHWDQQFLIVEPGQMLSGRDFVS